MVKKLIQLLSKEISGLHEAAYLLAFFAFASQILALVRDRLFASTFGASRVLDMYYAAFRIPDLLFVTIASLVSISILVPFFMEAQQKGVSLKRLINSIFSVFFLLMVIGSGLVFFLLPYIEPKLFPGFSREELESIIVLSRILLVSPFLLGISNFFASIVQMHNRFFLYAVSPILYNLGIIVGILVFYPLWGLYGLGFGVVLGALFHALVQVPFMIEKKTLPRFTLDIDFRNVRRIIALSIPRTVTLSTTSISAFALVSMASLMGEGSIAIFNFSLNLQSVPLSIIGVSYSSAVFPLLSRLSIEDKKTAFLERMITTSKHIIFWSLPVSALFIVLRAQIVRTILGAGQFSWSDTRLTAAALALFTFSIIAQSLILLFVRAFYAEGKTMKPLFINVLAMVVTIAAGYFFLWSFRTHTGFAYFLEALLRIENVPGAEVSVLALAYTVGILFNTVLHWIAFHREFSSYTRAVAGTFFKSLSASVIMGYVSYIYLNVFDNVFDLNTLPGIFFQGLCAGLVGICSGVLVLRLLRSQELEEVWKTLHRKIWKARVVVPGPEQL